MHANRSTTEVPRPSSVSSDLKAATGKPMNLTKRSLELQQQSTLAKLSLSLLQSRDEREARRQITGELTEQAVEMLKHKLSEDAENIRLEQEIRSQRQQDLQLNAHRHVMRSLGQQSENDLNEQCTLLFEEKKALLEQLAKMDGDDDLISLASQSLSAIAHTAFEDLHARNRRPR